MAIEFWAAGSNSIVSEISFVMTWLIQVLPWKTSKTRYWSRAKGVWDVGTVVCAVLEIAKINIVWEEWGNVSKMLEVSPTLLLLISDYDSTVISHKQQPWRVAAWIVPFCGSVYITLSQSRFFSFCYILNNMWSTFICDLCILLLDLPFRSLLLQTPGNRCKFATKTEIEVITINSLILYLDLSDKKSLIKTPLLPLLLQPHRNKKKKRKFILKFIY